MCAQVETSIDCVIFLEIPEICKARFSSTSCLNVCRSDSDFVLWYSRRENFVSYLISTQCWFLANHNKSFLSLQTSRLLFSIKYFSLLLNQSFFFIRDAFCECNFSKEHPIGFRGSNIIERWWLNITQFGWNEKLGFSAAP